MHFPIFERAGQDSEKLEISIHAKNKKFTVKNEINATY